MSPIVLLRDEAETTCLNEQAVSAAATALPPPPMTPGAPKKQESSLSDFLNYVDCLLSPQELGVITEHRGLLSPSFRPQSKRLSVYEDAPTTSKDAVEMALQGTSGSGQHHVFEIARNGHKVASVTLARPAYKLGESITALIDFSAAEIPCYHVSIYLLASTKLLTCHAAERFTRIIGDCGTCSCAAVGDVNPAGDAQDLRATL